MEIVLSRTARTRPALRRAACGTILAIGLGSAAALASLALRSPATAAIGLTVMAASVLLLLRLARLLDRDADTAVQAWLATHPGSTADQIATGTGLAKPVVRLSLARLTRVGALAEDGAPPRDTVCDRPSPSGPPRD